MNLRGPTGRLGEVWGSGKTGSANGVLSSVLLCTLLGRILKHTNHTQSRHKWKDTHIFPKLRNSRGSNGSSESSRLVLLILVWSHANLTITLWDILPSQRVRRWVQENFPTDPAEIKGQSRWYLFRLCSRSLSATVFINIKALMRKLQ